MSELTAVVRTPRRRDGAAVRQPRRKPPGATHDCGCGKRRLERFGTANHDVEFNEVLAISRMRVVLEKRSLNGEEPGRAARRKARKAGQVTAIVWSTGNQHCDD